MTPEQFKFIDQIQIKEGNLTLPNGCGLYWKTNEVGGRTYSSDEIGGGAHVWDTASIDISTLLAAITQEMTIQKAEAWLDEDDKLTEQTFERIQKYL